MKHKSYASIEWKRNILKKFMFPIFVSSYLRICLKHNNYDKTLNQEEENVWSINVMLPQNGGLIFWKFYAPNVFVLLAKNLIEA